MHLFPQHFAWLGYYCFLLCIAKGWLAQAAPTNVVVQQFSVCNTPKPCYGHEVDIEEAALLQHRSKVILDGIANKELSSEGPQLLTIFDKRYESFLHLWQTCAMKALGADEYRRRIRVVNTTEQKQTYENDALSLLDITPNYLQFALPRMLREGLAEGHDMMHVDIDAFLLKDPGIVFAKNYPKADIVSAVDCAGGPCNWYATKDYLARHNGFDPLGQRGFHLNMGVVLFRNNPSVLALFDEWISTRDAVGVTWGDQTLFNEVLLQWNCTWTLADATPLNSNINMTHVLISNSTLHGTCIGNVAQHTGKQLGNLSLVVLPYSTVTRNPGLDQHAAVIHPGFQNREEGVRAATMACS